MEKNLHRGYRACGAFREAGAEHVGIGREEFADFLFSVLKGVVVNLESDL